MNTAQKFSAVTAGSRVTGNYMGLAEFTGTVTTRRANTMNWNRHLVNVKLDTPIRTYGVEHEGICLEVEADGTDRYGSRIEEAA